MRRVPRVFLTVFVLTGYFVAVVGSALFHDHSGCAGCTLGSAKCASHIHSHEPSRGCGEQRPHHHGHHHYNHTHSTDHSPDENPPSDVPLDHNDCYVCQLQAHKPVLPALPCLTHAGEPLAELVAVAAFFAGLPPLETPKSRGPPQSMEDFIC